MQFIDLRPLWGSHMTSHTDTLEGKLMLGQHRCIRTDLLNQGSDQKLKFELDLEEIFPNCNFTAICCFFSNELLS